ncbi:MAG: RagB/SusD family nutrient uptake outer membrane protein [Bacteroidales bacterium]|nr:RagB/SusD family nutrient uptake outer membrane protein [Bacteroidales bacterium]MDT8431276.1 RagB/SusD family nutrient uptake outer membrane protein [Bacteroidales bacterium]
MRNGIIIAVFILLLAGGCSEFLVVEPDRQVSIVEQFSTKAGIDQAVNGMYYSLEAICSGDIFFYADLIGGNVTFSPARNDYIVEVPPALGIEQIYEFRDLERDSDMAGFYADAYGIINEANLIIERVAEHPLLSSAEINQMTAEALACRAWAHYMVAIVYAQNYSYTADASHPGVVYNTSTITAGEDYPSRLTLAESYRLMKEDMERALGLFGDRQALSYGPGYSWFNTTTASALLARMALQMHDWETAYALADSLIQFSGLSVMDSAEYAAEWEQPEDPVSEIVFELSAPRTSDDGSVSSSVARDFFGYVDQTNYNEFVASGDLLALYDTSDIRSGMFLEVLLPTSVNGIVTDQPYFFTKKFQDEPGTTVMRMSELYLIRAEAGARLGGTFAEGALEDLNAIRTRAGLAQLDGSADLLEEIFLERRRELAFEGHLLYDLARYHKDIVRDRGCISSVCGLAYPSDYYVLPIPESSTTLNENMEQNEGY